MSFKLITRNTDYAIRALGRIAAENGEVVSVATLVNDLGIPRPFLRKVLQELSRKGIVTSSKGLGGGFVLKAEPAHVRLLDIREAFQGTFSMNECIFKKKLCPSRGTCALRKKIGAIEQNVYDELKNVTLEDLIDGTKGNHSHGKKKNHRN
jgi:Rrf2 family protein